MLSFILRCIVFISQISRIFSYLSNNHLYQPMTCAKHILASSVDGINNGLNFSSTFRELDLPSWLVEKCEDLGFLTPTEVQSIGIPVILQGKDVILQAQTGSGKTLLYSLPVLTNIDSSRAAIQAVIIVPTRELGMQVASVVKALSSSYNKLRGPDGLKNKISVMTIVEGSKNRRQQLWATAEPPHIVIGNPKALQRIVDMGRLRLNSVSMVVIDEVDACLLNIETKKDLHKLLSRRLSNTYQSIDDILENEASSSSTSSFKLTEDLVYTDLTRKNSKIIQNQAETNYRNHRQTIFCSATIPQRQHFVQIAYKNGWTQTLAELIHVNPSEMTPIQIVHELIEYTNTAAVSAHDESLLISAAAVSNNNQITINDTEDKEYDRNEEVLKKKKAYLKYIIRQEIKKSIPNTTSSATTVNKMVDTKDSENNLITLKSSPLLLPLTSQFIVFVENPTVAFDVCAFLIQAIPSLIPSVSSTMNPTELLSMDNSSALKAISTVMSVPLPVPVPLSVIVKHDSTDDLNTNRFRSPLRRKRNALKLKHATTNDDEEEEGDEEDDKEEDARKKKLQYKISKQKQNVASLDILTVNTSDEPEDNDGDEELIHNDYTYMVMRLDETMSLDQRALALDKYRQGVCRVLVCTDLAARGIDVPSTSLVIQWNIPKTSEQYLHRAGRTGRLGREGRVITFITDEQEFVMKRFANELNIEMKKKNLKIVTKK